MVEESDCSAKEKRWRIMESLKGPALGVVRAVQNFDQFSVYKPLRVHLGLLRQAKICILLLLQQQPKEKI